MAAPAAQPLRQPAIPTPEQILEGYERAVGKADTGQALDRWCWQVVMQVFEGLGPDEGATLHRIAKYKVLNGSLHGFRIGMATASARRRIDGAKGQIRAECELLICLEAAYDKWRSALIIAAGGPENLPIP